MSLFPTSPLPSLPLPAAGPQRHYSSSPLPTLQIFLSATLSNASEFAAWVAHLHKQPCHVVYTDYRPTPLQVMRGEGERGGGAHRQVVFADYRHTLLQKRSWSHTALPPLPPRLYLRLPRHCSQHYAYAIGGSGLHLVLDERGNFRRVGGVQEGGGVKRPVCV